jgi:hypothetical protein
MRRGWLRRNRLTTTLLHTIRLCGRVWLPLLLLAASTFRRATHPESVRQVKIKPISLVKSLSGGLGPKTRRPPGRLCRAFRIPVFCSFAVGIPLVPTQASILSYSRASSTPPAIQTEKEYEKAAQIKSDDFGENERDALHSTATGRDEVHTARYVATAEAAASLQI